MEGIEKYKLEIIVFLSGACGMILELTGSRVVSPYFGNSLYVWTSLIGVILGALSLGYYWGGKIADKSQSYVFLSTILLMGGVLTGAIAFLKEIILSVVSGMYPGRIDSVSILAIFILFGPISVLLGIISPYAARLKLKEIKSSGRVVGNLYALSTLGSIVGTFLAGYWLIPFFGNTNILYFVAGVLVMTSILALGKFKKVFFWGIISITCLYFAGNNIRFWILNTIADVDTQYSRILVRDRKNQEGRIVRYLTTDNSGWESAIYLDNPDELVFDYTKAYRLSNMVGLEIKSALMIGGAAYTYPRDFLIHNPAAKIDVVEIDPKMTEVARTYFQLKDDPRMKIIHEDARTCVKNSDKKYDVIFLDAFMGVTPPAHLTTKEFMSDLKNILSDNGVLMINLISPIGGKDGRLFEEEANTVKTMFPYLDVYMVQNRPSNQYQNLMFVAYKSELHNQLEVSDLGLKELISRKVTVDKDLDNGQILTDDHAPVEYLTRNFSP